MANYRPVILALALIAGCTTQTAKVTPAKGPQCPGPCGRSCLCAYPSDCETGKCITRQPDPLPRVIILDPTTDGTVIDVRILPEE